MAEREEDSVEIFHIIQKQQEFYGLFGHTTAVSYENHHFYRDEYY